MKKNRVYFLILIVFILFFLNVNSVRGYNSYNMGDVNQSVFTSSSTSSATLFLIIFVLLIGMLAAAIWVYLDAKKHGEPGGLWLIVILISNYIGLIIWLIFRPTLKEGKHVENNLNYSPISNTEYNTPKTDTRGRICPNCGRPIPFDAKLCPYCGKRFKSYI